MFTFGPQVILPPLTCILTSLYCIHIKNEHINVDYMSSSLQNLVLQVSVHMIVGVHGSDSDFLVSDFLGLFLVPIVTSVIFYCVHRLFHTKFLWPYHALHHDSSNVTGYMARTCHPMEHIVANLLPVYLSGLICRLSVPATTLWYCLAEFNSVTSHDDIASFHYQHHLRPNTNYGLSYLYPFMDVWFKTTKC